MYVITAIKSIQTIMVITANAVITAIMATTATMEIIEKCENMEPLFQQLQLFHLCKYPTFRLQRQYVIQC